MSVNKKVIGLIAVLIAIVCTVISIMFITIGSESKTTHDVPAVEDSAKVIGYRYDLTEKEEQMLRQYSLDMKNTYNLEVSQYYVEDINETSILMHIKFDNDRYLGEIEYTEGSDWVARLKEVTN